MYFGNIFVSLVSTLVVSAGVVREEEAGFQVSKSMLASMHGHDSRSSQDQ